MDHKRPQRATTGKAGKRPAPVPVSASPIAPDLVVPESTIPDAVVRRDRKASTATNPQMSGSSAIAMSTALAEETPAPVITEAPAAAITASEAPVEAELPAAELIEAEPVVAKSAVAETKAPIAFEPVFAPAPEPVMAAAVSVEPVISSEPAPEAAPAPEPAQTPPLPLSPVFAGHSVFQSHKDMIMDMSTNFGTGINDVLAGAQDKAKEAFEKSTSMLGEAGSFARGNVEAAVESGKILAAGLQDMSTNLVAEGRGAFETMTADLKELAASKTPADFFKVQGEMMRKSLDSAVAYGSKNSEAMLKLASDVFAPLSGRVNLAVEKVKTPLV